MVMKWFRRNQKLLLAIMVGVLMVAWGALPGLSWLARRGASKRGEIGGRTVSEEDLRSAALQLDACVRQRLLQKGTLIGQFIFADQEDAATPRATSDAVWRYLILVREAEAAGVQVTADELQNLFAQTRLPSDDRALWTAVGNLLRILKLLTYQEECVQVTNPELWMEYNYQERAAKIRLVELKPELFLSQVDATPEEVKAFYEERRDAQPDLRTGKVGYQAPERVRLEYALARVEDFEKQVSVSEEEIRAFYEEHQDEFKPPENKEESQQGKEEPGQEGAGEAGTEPEAGEAPPGAPAEQPQEGESGETPSTGTEKEQGGDPPGEPGVEAPGQSTLPDAQPAPEKPGPAEQGTATEQEQPGQQAQPLSPEIQEKIRKELVNERAREAARQQVEKVLDDLEEVAESYVNQPWPLEQMAKRHDLHYETARTETGELLLGRRDVQLKVPGGAQVAGRVFDENLEPNVPSLLDTPPGSLVIQVLERREPEARPFEEVADQVRGDVLRIKGLAKARTVAEKLKESAAASSLDQAVGEMNERLNKLLGEPEQPAGSPTEESADESNPADTGVQTSRPTWLKVEQSDFIPRYSTYVPVLGKARPDVVREAFRLDADELAVVEESGPDPACYVIQKVGEKAAAPALFYESGDMLRGFAAYRKRQLAVQGWLNGLAAKMPPPVQKGK